MKKKWPVLIFPAASLLSLLLPAVAVHVHSRMGEETAALFPQSLSLWQAAAGGVSLPAAQVPGLKAIPFGGWLLFCSLILLLVSAGLALMPGKKKTAPALIAALASLCLGGATSGVDLYRRKGQVSVMSPSAISYAHKALSDEGQQKRAQFAPVMKDYSWKCVYSATDEEFEENWKYMVETAKSYGYDDVVAEYMTDIEACFAFMDAND